MIFIMIQGWTVMLWAVSFERLAVVNVVLKAGADVNAGSDMVWPERR
jgi:ankyrin repeat protein